MSAAVRALETDLGTALFDRSTRRVTLTAAGEALLPEAKAALEALDRAQAVVEEASAGLRGNLRIGTLAQLRLVDMAGLLGAFHRKYPLVDVQVTTSPTGSTGLADDVRHGRLDLALVGLSRAELFGLEIREIATVRFVVLLPSSHRLADRPEVRLEDLAGERFVDMLPGFGNRTMVDRAFDNAGIPRRVHVEVPVLTTVPDYVSAGLGIAVVPELEPTKDPGVVQLPLAGADLAWTLTVVTSRGRRPSRAATALLDLIDDSIRPDGLYF